VCLCRIWVINEPGPAKNVASLPASSCSSSSRKGQSHRYTWVFPLGYVRAKRSITLRTSGGSRFLLIARSAPVAECPPTGVAREVGTEGERHPRQNRSYMISLLFDGQKLTERRSRSKWRASLGDIMKNGKRRSWTSADVRTLKALARKKTRAGKIAKTLKRTEGATH
jgi:hypothetical protein